MPIAKPARSPRLQHALRVLAALLILFPGASLQAAAGRSQGCAHHSAPDRGGEGHHGVHAAEQGDRGSAPEAPPACECPVSCVGGAAPSPLEVAVEPRLPPLSDAGGAAPGEAGRRAARAIPFLLPFATAPPPA